MTRADAIARAQAQISSDVFLKELDRRVGFKTESLNAERAGVLRAYLEEELTPAFAELDFTSRLIESPSGKTPFLLAQHQSRGAARGARNARRQARLQCQIHRRNGRGDRLARSRRGL